MEPRAASLDLDRPDAYGRSFADVYDDWYGTITDAEATARFVAHRAGDRPVLELGAGSGRLAVALARRCRIVVGLDASAAMLRRCPGTAGLHLVRADMRALPLQGPFGAVLIAFNTLFNLGSTDEQGALLVAIGPLLGRSGSLVVETIDVSALGDGPDRSIGLRSAGERGVVVTATRLQRAAQVLTGQHLEIGDRGITVRPWRLHWLTTAQLDRLAGEAGLTLTERHGSWSGGPAGPAADTCISVYRPRS